MVRWQRVCVPIAYLRRMSPSADAQQTRRLSRAILWRFAEGADGPLRAERIEPVGRYLFNSFFLTATVRVSIPGRIYARLIRVQNVERPDNSRLIDTTLESCEIYECVSDSCGDLF